MVGAVKMYLVVHLNSTDIEFVDDSTDIESFNDSADIELFFNSRQIETRLELFHFEDSRTFLLRSGFIGVEEILYKISL